MSKTLRSRRIVSRPLAGSLAIFLTFALTSPVWAVVFTNPATITINDGTTANAANPYPSNIAVSGLMGTVTNVTVTLNNFNHTFPTDLDMLLVGPGGGAQNIVFFADTSNGDDITNRTVNFTDGSPAVPTVGPLPSSTFSPTNGAGADAFPSPAPAPSANTTLAAAFNGIDPNGTWSLYISDETAADVGTMGNGWSLTITTNMSSATTFTNGGAVFLNDSGKGSASAYPSTITSSGLFGAITDVNVTLTNLSHLNPDDLDILLVGPSGKRILLMSDAGGTADAAGITLTFDDAAAATVPDAGPLVTGSVRPTNFSAIGDFINNQTAIYPNSATAGGATLASVFNGTDPNGTWSLYVVDDLTLNTGNIMGGWSVDITAGGSYGEKRYTSSDFDGDGRTDVAQFRSSDGTWYWRDSNSYANHAHTQFGSSGDILVPGDYDGDRRTDFAVFRPSDGVWYIIQSATSTLRQAAWGQSGDIPVPADYDNDGQADLAIWRSGVWHVLQGTTSTRRVVFWGISGDLPQRGHFEGTGGADFAVFRPSDNNWYILNSAGSSSRVENLGATGDLPVPADYDGDGKTDVAVYRGSSGDFYISQSSTGTVLGRHWGMTGDIPVPGDYDGDSRADVAVWRPSTGTWYLLNSGTPPGAGALRVDNWGRPTDVPVPYTYVSQQIVP